MKTKILLILLFISSYTFGQVPTGYVARYDFSQGSPTNLASPGIGDLTGTIDQIRTDRFNEPLDAIRVNGHQLNGYTTTTSQTDLTIAFWMKGSGPTSGYQRIFKIIDSNGNGIDMANLSGNSLHASFRIDGNTHATSATINGLYDGDWHHVTYVVSHDGANYTNLIYVDGVVQTAFSTLISTSSTTNILTSGAQFIISPQSANLFYDQIDDILIYESDLTQQSITDLLNATAPIPTPLPATGCVARYDFSQGSPTNLASPGIGDLTGTIDQLRSDRFNNGNHAILVNGHQLNGYTTTTSQTDLTIAFWMKGSGPTIGYQRIFKIIDSNGNGIDMANLSGNSLHASFRIDGNTHATSATINGLYDSNWHHVTYVVSHDGANYTNLIYVDGVVQTAFSTLISTASTTNILTSGAQFIISPQSGSLFYDHIDDILIYESDLTQQNITDLVNYNPVSNTNLSAEEYDLEKFAMYPNPSSSTLNIKMSSGFEKAEIYTLQGQKVLETNLDSIDVSNLSNGIYLIRVQTKTGAVLTKQFIKR